jgi:hypothetical protein
MFEDIDEPPRVMMLYDAINKSIEISSDFFFFIMT